MYFNTLGCGLYEALTSHMALMYIDSQIVQTRSRLFDCVYKPHKPDVFNSDVQQKGILFCHFYWC